MSSTNGKTLARELYPTPDLVVNSLLESLTFKPNDIFLEPCRGTDTIFNKVKLPAANKTPIIIPRPRFVNAGSDSCEYCWFIWDRGNRFNIPEGLSHLISKAA